MVYAASSFFILGLLLLGARMYAPAGNSKHDFLQYAGMGALFMILLSCVLVAYTGVSGGNKEMPVALSGDFGLSGASAANRGAQTVDRSSLGGNPPDFPNKNSVAAPTASAQNPFGQQGAASGVPSVFSLAQSSQICAGFSDIAMGALLAGSNGEAYAPYEEKARRLSEQVMRLPFVREAGTKPMQNISNLFATLIEDQYYISPQNRAVQLGLIGKVDKKLALDAMNQVCELKILEIRSK